MIGCALAPAAVLAYLIAAAHARAGVRRRYPVSRRALLIDQYRAMGLVGGNPQSAPRICFPARRLADSWSSAAYDWRASLSDRRLRLCAAFAIAGFLSCYPRPDIIHISYSATLALPLLAYCMTRLTQSWRPAYRYAAAAVMIGALSPSAHHFQQLARRALRAEIVPTPRGDVAPIGPYTGQQGVPELLARHRGSAVRGRLFLLSLRRDAAIPDWARTRVEIRSLCARVHHARPISGGLPICYAEALLGRRRSDVDRPQ